MAAGRGPGDAMTAGPLIGVTMSVTVDRVPERAYVNASYLRAVQEAGGVPVLLPPHLDARSLRALRERLDGLLVTGGGDIDPVRFAEPRHPRTAEVSDIRDALEIDLVRAALDRALPLLGICRGIQVMNVVLGGSLWQDIPSQYSPGAGGLVAHSQSAPREQPTHRVKIEPGSRLARVLDATEVEVNSMHHQALRALGRGLRAVGWSPDGIVEGVEMPDVLHFVLGVQWHPEELVGHDEAARKIFRALVEAAALGSA